VGSLKEKLSDASTGIGHLFKNVQQLNQFCFIKWFFRKAVSCFLEALLHKFINVQIDKAVHGSKKRKLEKDSKLFVHIEDEN
jgi:hypothetical protein